MRKRLVVLDASAVLAWVLREQGHKVIDRLLTSAVLPSSAMVGSSTGLPSVGTD